MTDWRPIPGWPLYEAGSDGTIRNVRTGKVLASRPNKAGYLLVDLHGGVRYGMAAKVKQTTRLVSRLVCSAFHGLPPEPDLEAAHGDNKPANNVPSNLRWATSAENKADKKLHGTEALGERRFGAKLTAFDVFIIRGSWHPETKMAELMGVNRATIGKIRRYEKWKHVD